MMRPLQKKALCVLLVFVLVCSFWIYLKSTIADIECSDIHSIQYLDELCTNYSRGTITGSLCDKLCVEKEIKFSKCLGHGVKPHVLSASWKGVKIMLKAARTPGNEMGEDYFLQFLSPPSNPQVSLSFTKEEFIREVSNGIYGDFAQKNPTLVKHLIEQVLVECDLKQDEFFDIKEITSCWHLLESKEYRFYHFLSGNSAFPSLLGVCGNMFAVQYAPSEPFLGYLTSWSEVRDWKFRAQLALGLLKMVKSLENTVFGTVYLCDVQESNFGVMKEQDGSLIAKAIDMDISFFEHSLKMVAQTEKNNSCSSDKDCEFVSCLIKCDQKTKTCAGSLSSSNLRAMCTRLFTQWYALQPALLLNPPRTIAKELKQVLEQCAQSESPHLDLHILKQLELLLISSIT